MVLPHAHSDKEYIEYIARKQCTCPTKDALHVQFLTLKHKQVPKSMKHYETSCFTSRCFMMFHPVRSMDPWIRPPHDPCLRPCTNGNRLPRIQSLGQFKEKRAEIRTKKSAERLLHLSLEPPHRHPHPATTRAHSDVLTQQAPKKALHLEPLVQPTRRTEHE